MTILNRYTLALLLPGCICLATACGPSTPTIVLKVSKELPVSDAAELSRAMLERIGTVRKGDSDRVARYYVVQLNKGVQISENALIVMDYAVIGTSSPIFRVADNGEGTPVRDGDTIAVDRLERLQLKGPQIDAIAKMANLLVDSMKARKEKVNIVPPAMDSMMTAFARKDAQWIVQHSAYPFQISIGHAVDAKAIADPARLQKALERLFRENYFVETLNKESLVDSLQVTYLSRFYNDAGELEGESGLIFVFEVGPDKQLLLQQFFLAG